MSEKPKTTTFAVSKKTYNKILSLKHELETESESSWSFDAVIEYLADNHRRAP